MVVNNNTLVNGWPVRDHEIGEKNAPSTTFYLYASTAWQPYIDFYPDFILRFIHIYLALPVKKFVEHNENIQVISTTSKEKAEIKTQERPAGEQTSETFSLESLNKQVLELKCNKYKLVATGTQKQLAERLLKHFQEIRNNEILTQDVLQLDKTAQKIEEAGPSLPSSRHKNSVNEAETNRQQNEGPCIAELASSIQNQTEIVMGLTKAQEHSSFGECINAERKRTHNKAAQVHQEPQMKQILTHLCLYH